MEGCRKGGGARLRGHACTQGLGEGREGGVVLVHVCVPAQEAKEENLHANWRKHEHVRTRACAHTPRLHALEESATVPTAAEECKRLNRPSSVAPAFTCVQQGTCLAAHL